MVAGQLISVCFGGTTINQTKKIRLLSKFFIWRRKSWYQYAHDLIGNFKSKQSINSWKKWIYLLWRLLISSAKTEECLYFWNRKFCLKFFLSDLSFQILSSLKHYSLTSSFCLHLRLPCKTALGTNILQLNISCSLTLMYGHSIFFRLDIKAWNMWHLTPLFHLHKGERKGAFDYFPNFINVICSPQACKYISKDLYLLRSQTSKTFLLTAGQWDWKQESV